MQWPAACLVRSSVVLQPDYDELRIEERVTEEFLGAAPRAAGLVGAGLRRRPTFRVRSPHLWHFLHLVLGKFACLDTRKAFQCTAC